MLRSHGNISLADIIVRLCPGSLIGQKPHMQHAARFLKNRCRHTAFRIFRTRCEARLGICTRAAKMASDYQPDRTSGRTHVKPLLSVAPMMDWTDIHYRQLARLISKHTWLWTEMVVDKTIIHSPLLDKWLWYPPEQHPIVLQMGGNEPELLRQAAKIAATYGYDEFNLNCGCPSDRVAGAGCFGASLMLQPELVARCMVAIAQGAGPDTPVSVKCRLGVDDADSYQQLMHFVNVVSTHGGVKNFIIHARKCILRGVSPAQNRSVPPLRHEWVWSLKRDFPHLSFQLNGGVISNYTAAGAVGLNTHGLGPGAIDGVMVGRAAYNDPWGTLGDADVAVFGAESNPAMSRRQVIQDYCKYADAMIGRWQVKEDGYRDPSIRVLIRPVLNLFHGDRGGKRWKAAVDEDLRTSKHTTVSSIIKGTLHHIPDAVLDAPPKSAKEVAMWQNNGTLPGPYSLQDRLAQPGDRARGENERRGRQKHNKQVQQQMMVQEQKQIKQQRVGQQHAEQQQQPLPKAQSQTVVAAVGA